VVNHYPGKYDTCGTRNISHLEVNYAIPNITSYTRITLCCAILYKIQTLARVCFGRPCKSISSSHFTEPTYFSKIHSHIILPSMPRSSGCSLPFSFSDSNFLCIFPGCVTYPAHFIFFDLITLIVFGEE
jgi:hypothetical protein